MKIYLATSGEYSSYRVAHAFARQEDAESYPLADDVQEFELHDGPVEVRTWYKLTWRGDRGEYMGTEPRGLPNPYVYVNERRDFDGDEKRVVRIWSRGYMQEIEGDAHLTVEGWDLSLVKKVYSEQRAQYLARQEGIS